MHFFDGVTPSPKDPLFGLNQAFLEDPREEKVNLGIGVYKTAELKPLILNCVKTAERLLIESEESKDYLPIRGEPSFIEATEALVFGKENLNPRLYGAQTTGATAALRVGAQFLVEQGLGPFFLPDPTWDNHSRILKHAGARIETYPYYDLKKRSFDFQSLYSSLENMPKRSVILLHTCCHNPTGFDPNKKEWEKLLEEIQNRGILPFFDFAYQGFGEGIAEDREPLRHFMEREMEGFVAYSYAKNFGLYAERTGALFAVCNHPDVAKKIGSHLQTLIRGLYSNPPCHGGRIVSTVLANPKLRTSWEEELFTMRMRIQEMRKLFLAALQAKAKHKAAHFDLIGTQKGMFSYTGLEEDEVDQLIADFGIYLPKDGRVNVSGLNTENIDYVAEAFAAVHES